MGNRRRSSVSRFAARVVAASLLVLPSTASADMSTSTLDVVRQYGDGPVAVPAAVDRATVRFDGQRGDRVRLSGGNVCPESLWLGTRRVRAEASGFFRLPARGEYRMTWPRCAQKRRAVQLQLQLLVVHRLHVDVRYVRVARRTGYVEAVAVAVPEQGRVRITPSALGTHDDRWAGLVLPDGTTYTRRDCAHDSACEDGDTTFLEAGRPIGGWEGPYAAGPDGQSVVTKAGERVLFLTAGPVTYRARTSAVREVQLDGEPIDLGSVRPLQEMVLEADLLAGQWFRVERVSGADFLPLRFVRPDGTQEPGPWAGTDFWQAPVAGTYRVLAHRWDVPVDAVVRLRSIRVGPPLPLDGTPVEYAITTPGEWVVAPAPVPGTYTMSVTSRFLGFDWFVDLDARDRYFCDIYGSDSCGESEFVHFSRLSPEPGSLGRDEPATVMVGMVPDQTGSVTLSVSPPAPR